jgi:acyl-CoA synthetase (AMP-forming)/AMP-acid ligase II
MFNFASLLDRYAERSPDKEAVWFGGRWYTYAELDTRVGALSAGLSTLGVQEGDVVALLLKNRLEFLELVFAINRVGAIFLPLNYRLAAAEWRYILEHSGSSVLVTEAEYVEAMQKARPSTLRSVGLVGESAPAVADFDYDELLIQHSGARLATVEARLEDVQRLMYTSGTTSRPKGVPLSHGNVLWKTFGHLVDLSLTSADRTLMVGPMYHVGALDLPGLGTLYVGGSVGILPRFDAAEVMAAIGELRPTNIWLAPAMMNAILQLDGADGYDTTSIRLIVNGGEKMPVPFVKRLLDIFPHAWLADAYGLTETASGDTFVDRDHVISKIGSVGKPVPHLAVRILDANDQTAGPNVPGEILLRGPKVFNGYWKDPDATADAFVDGWFRTGDIGHVDEDGYLYIDDRKKDMIVSGGENIATPEIERVLYEYPDVVEAAVIGVPDPTWGEVPKAVIVLRPGSTATTDELRRHCSDFLARFKVPKHFEFRDSLPRNPSGKVLKRELR